MAVEILGQSEREGMRRAGAVAAATLRRVTERIEPGISTRQIDDWVREDTLARGGIPSQLGYRVRGVKQPFPAAVCTSVNHVVCHGIPAPECVLKNGDIVNVDVTTCFEGFHGDTSVTVMVGEVRPEVRHLVEVSRRCLLAGIEQVHPGARLGEIGAAVSQLAHAEGFSVVREFGGHGIGRLMHAAPHVPHFGSKRHGIRLKPGMAFTIEPMINQGRAEVEVLDDGWTVVTQDRQLSVQFEHTVLVTETGVEVLTMCVE